MVAHAAGRHLPPGWTVADPTSRDPRGRPDVPDSRLGGIYFEACKTACKHPSCRTSRGRVLLRWVDTRRELSSPGRAVRRPGDEPTRRDGQVADSGSPNAPRFSLGGSSDGLPRPESASCLPPADLHH